MRQAIQQHLIVCNDILEKASKAYDSIIQIGNEFKLDIKVKSELKEVYEVTIYFVGNKNNWFKIKEAMCSNGFTHAESLQENLGYKSIYYIELW